MEWALVDLKREVDYFGRGSDMVVDLAMALSAPGAEKHSTSPVRTYIGWSRRRGRQSCTFYPYGQPAAHGEGHRVRPGGV